MAGLKRVLVVDNDEGVRKLLAASLARAGYGVDLGKRGKEALETADPDKHGLLIMEEEQFALLSSESVAWCARGLRVPVILLAEGLGPPGPVPGLSGIERLNKPFSLAELIGFVERLLPHGKEQDPNSPSNPAPPAA